MGPPDSSSSRPVLPRTWRNNLSPRRQWEIQWIWSGETWVAVTHLNEATEDLSLPDYEPDLIVLSPMDRTLPAMALQLVVPAGERRGFIQR